MIARRGFLAALVAAPVAAAKSKIWALDPPLWLGFSRLSGDPGDLSAASLRDALTEFQTRDIGPISYGASWLDEGLVYRRSPRPGVYGTSKGT